MTRPLPRVTPETEFFWTSGRDGMLRFLRCRDCLTLVHPPAPRCPRCLSPHVGPHPVEGIGTVLSYTFVESDDGEEPAVVAWIGFPEQGDLRLTARLVGVAPGNAWIGMPVAVRFEPHDDVFVPVFEPRDAGDG